jgi:hypothetical protein
MLNRCQTLHFNILLKLELAPVLNKMLKSGVWHRINKMLKTGHPSTSESGLPGGDE